MNDLGDWELPETEQAQQATRLVNLAYLLSGTPRTFEEILTEMGRIGAYRGTFESARRAFTRDKQRLRTLGVDVVETDSRYAIRARTVSPERDLTPEELAAAVIAGERLLPSVDPDVRRDLRSALAKLGAGERLEPPVWQASRRVSRVLLIVHDAHRCRRPIQIHYTNANGETSARILHPWALRSNDGDWYVRGWDEQTASERTFKVARIDPDRIAFMQGDFREPPDPEATMRTLAAEPWEWGSDDPVAVRIRLPASFAPHVLPAHADLVSDAEASEAELTVRDTDAFSSWILRHGTVVKLLGPPSVRDQLVARLEAIFAALEIEPHVPEGLAAAFGNEGPAGEVTAERQVARADRLLRLIGLAGRREYTNAELAAVLEVSEEELADDLAQLTYYCGLPPLYGGDTVDAIPFAGRVRVKGPALPLVEQLTGREVAALAIALRTALADSTLEAGSRAVLESALQVICPESESMTVESPATGREGATILAAIAAGARDMRSVDITHWSPQTGIRKQRRVDPWRLGEVRGRTYLIGWDHASGERRVFRTDRIEAVALTTERFTRPEDDTTDFGETGYLPSPGDVHVYVRLPAGHADWARARYGEDSVVEIEGTHVLRLPASDLERIAPLLLSLMPAAEILAPPQARVTAADLARRLLTDLSSG